MTPSADWSVFPDGELHVRAAKKPRAHAVIETRLREPEDFWRAALLADALRAAGAKRVTLVTPYLGYARQDRRVKPGDSAGGPLLLRVLAAAGVTRVVSADVHGKTRSVPGLALVSVDAPRLFAASLKRRLGRLRAAVIAPDHGALRRARAIAKRLKSTSVAWVEKHRVGGARIETGSVHGRIAGDVAVIVDDILSTGMTMEASVKAAKAAGIRRIWVAVTHAVFAPGAATRLERLGVERLFVSDSLPKPKTRVPTEVVSVQALLKKAAH